MADQTGLTPLLNKTDEEIPSEHDSNTHEDRNSRRRRKSYKKNNITSSMAKAEAYAARHAYGEVGDDTEEESDLNEEEIRRLQEATPDTRKKLKSEIDGDHTGKIGPFSTFFTLFKGFVATGVLFLPKGFASGGWFFTSFALVLCSILTIFASVKLVQTRLKHRVSFSEIGRKAFGLPGKIAVDFFLAVTQFLFVTAYIGFISGSVNNILVNTFKTDPINVWIIGAVCFAIYTPLCWVRKIEKFAFFHIFADIAIAIGLIVIMIYGTKNAVNNGFASDVELINNKTFLTAIGLAAYTFEGVGLIVPVMETTSRPDIYPHILSGVILLITFIYLFFGNWLYFSYGKTEVAKHPLVTDMLPADEIPIVIVDIVW
eukprot:CAMPEP_0197003506 /NCGR_PEP_ID=MMETSP1380-20130617/7746_1 /TAXON_ID=5936 /ORGANISM="Euplotes crassus, Strain CT5" /LENGTH=371 /DNA_ID=CAMNT_0042422027 /DNA_START=16 /DNA_END=1128 /DNA_ORIENTATION=+